MTGHTEAIDAAIKELVDTNEPEIDRLKSEAIAEQNQADLDNAAADDLEGQANTKENELANLISSNALTESERTQHWIDEVADMKRRNGVLDQSIEALRIQLSQQEADIQKKGDDLISINAAITATQKLVDDARETIRILQEETHPEQIKEAEDKLANTLQDIIDEQTVENNRYQELVDELARQLAEALEEVRTRWADKLTQAVEDHVARSEDTVFEVCTRIERTDDQGHFRVETVTHGDIDEAGAQLLQMAQDHQ